MERHLGCAATRVARMKAFVTNAVYEVDANDRRLIVKASTNRNALRAEAWACARAAAAGFPTPETSTGVHGIAGGIHAFAMQRIPGAPITAAHPAFGELGAAVRGLHGVTLAGFGVLGDAAWDARGGFSLPYSSWLDYLHGICSDARALAAQAHEVADATAVIDAHAPALAAVGGALLHGDLKADHILVTGENLSGVIDWGDAVVGDPLWEIARYAHRGDAASLALLLKGYDPNGAFAEELAWKLPLYSRLWMLVDAIVDHRLA